MSCARRTTTRTALSSAGQTAGPAFRNNGTAESSAREPVVPLPEGHGRRGHEGHDGSRVLPFPDGKGQERAGAEHAAAAARLLERQRACAVVGYEKM